MSTLPARGARRASEQGAVLILVLWVAFGLVSLALYFGQSMAFELRASDNRTASLEAEQAIEGAARYITYLLATPEEPGKAPNPQTYQREAVAVGDATFWLIGRDNTRTATDEPYFSLVDEASKLNLNTATLEMLEALPRMTPGFAAAITDWRDSDSDVSEAGAEDETYLRRNPPHKCKNALFESTDELRLVFGAELEILYGEDMNRNGILDPNENDGDASPPHDNRDGKLEPGILEYLTVYSREPNTKSDGTQRISLGTQGRQQLASLLQETFGVDRANRILQRLGGPNSRFLSALEFFVRSGMTAEEFAQISGDLTVTTGEFTEGLVNVNTAQEEVLACIPGVGTDKAASLVAFRQANPGKLTSVAWVAEVLDQEGAVQAGPFLTSHTYQFTADVAASGHFGHGYRRARFIFDVSGTTPAIRYRQDLSHLGWALGKRARQNLQQLAAR